MPGPVAQSVASLIADPGVLSLIPARPNSPSADSRRVVDSRFKRKYVN